MVREPGEDDYEPITDIPIPCALCREQKMGASSSMCYDCAMREMLTNLILKYPISSKDLKI